MGALILIIKSRRGLSIGWETKLGGAGDRYGDPATQCWKSGDHLGWSISTIAIET